MAETSFGTPAEALVSARELLRRVGVSTSFADDDLREVLSAAGSASSGASTPPSTTSGGHAGHSSRLSLPSDLLEELRSPLPPSASAVRGGGRGGGAGMAPIEVARHEYEQRIERLMEQLATLQHEKRLAEVDANRRLRAAQAAAAAAADDATARVAAAAAARGAAEARAAEATERLAASKAHFADLALSHALYDELRRKPVDALSLREFIQVRVYETVSEARGALERLRQEHDAAVAAWAEARAGYERTQRDALHRAAVAEGREAGLAERVALHEGTIARTQARLAEALAAAESNAAKGAAYDSLEARKRELEVVHERDARLLAAQDASAQVAKADRDAAVARAADLQLRLDVLVADKAALAAAVEEARAAARRAADALASTEDRLVEATRARDAYQAQLAVVHSDARSAAEERLAAEVRRLREGAAKELEDIRAASKEAADRELRGAREARADALAEAARATERAASLQRQLDDVSRTARSADAEALTTAAELRGALKLKAYEVERATAAAAEAADTVRRVTADADVLRDKAALLQNEYTKLQAAADTQRATLEAALAAERDKVATYESLEADLDAAIVAAGGAAGGAADGGGAWATLRSGAPDGAGDAGFTLAAGVPTTARRRMRQAVLLAKELVVAQRDIAALKARLAEAQRAAAAAAEGEASARTMLEACRGPQEYLVAALRAAEGDKRDARAALADAQAQLTYARNTLAAVDAARVAAEADLRRVLAARNDTDALADMVRSAIAMRSAVTLHPPAWAAAGSGASRGSAPAPTPSGAPADAAGMAALVLALQQAMSAGAAASAAATATAPPLPPPAAPAAASAAPPPAPPSVSASTATHGPLAASDLHAPSAPRSGMSTPLGSVTSRTTPPPPPAAPTDARLQHTSATSFPLHTLEGGAALEYSAHAPLPAGIRYVADRSAPAAAPDPSTAFLRTLPASGGAAAGAAPRWHRRVQA